MSDYHLHREGARDPEPEEDETPEYVILGCKPDGTWVEFGAGTDVRELTGRLMDIVTATEGEWIAGRCVQRDLIDQTRAETEQLIRDGYLEDWSAWA